MIPIDPSNSKKVEALQEMEKLTVQVLGWDRLVISNERGIHGFVTGVPEWIKLMRELLFDEKIQGKDTNETH